MSEDPKINKLDELEMAFAFFAGMEEDCQAYVSKRDGSIVQDVEVLSGEPCPVEDIEFNDDYLPLPDKRELDLGTRLVWRFVRQEIPGLEPKVREIFSRRGAYRRWKDFLDRNDLLDQWYSFENEATTRALLEWCEENGVPITD
jgi:hypothetical protein